MEDLTKANRNLTQQVRSALVRFGVTYLVLLVVIPVVLLFVFMDPIYWWWFQQSEAPALQQQLGFTAEEREILDPDGKRWALLVITRVVEGGRFEKAGAKADDVVVCLHHGSPDFWSKVRAVQEGFAQEIRVVAIAEVQQGCSGARRLRFEGRSITGAREPQNNQMQQTRSAMATRRGPRC